MSDFRDLNTGNAKQRTCAFVSERGFDAWYTEYAERADMLTEALAKYNNGRMKRFICEIFIQRELTELRVLMQRAREITGEPKEAGKEFRKLAEGTEENEFGK